MKFVRNLFVASKTSLAGRIFASNLSADDQPRLTFAVIGDWGRQGSPSQRQVAKQISASKAEWKLVFGHHPTYSSGLAHGNQPEIIQYVLPILEKHHVQAYFAGHDHDLEHLKLDRLHLIVSGAGSEHRPVKSPTTSPFSRACSGFVMASVGENNMQVRFFDGEGHNLYSANLVHDPSTERGQ